MAKNINISSIKKITVLGEGKTAKAVIKKLNELALFELTNDTTNTDLVIISPGLDPKKYTLGITAPIISEIELAYLLFQYYQNPPKLITITGTNGKTTTTDLISQLLNIPSAGNIGVPLIEFVSNNPLKVPKTISLEASSYQLEMSPNFKPEIYILMNITEDHLERHGTMKEYARIKLKVLHLLTDKDYFIYNSKDSFIMSFLSKNQIKAQLIDLQDRESVSQFLKESPLLGEHNQENLSAAINASLIINQESVTVDKIKNIKAYPHRLEKVRTINNIEFINDSKATNPDSTIAALNSIPSEKIILLLGGDKKAVSYQTMFNLIKKKKVRSIAFGGARDFFYEELKDSNLLLGNTHNLEEAINLAYNKSNSGDIILLSPACASFDMYKNFEERGNDFKQIVSAIPNNK
ncbi:MAG: UDP-N-acetylmuramoyl-L-alanine--D-glutamate ligase [Candidatus Margulisbacteria bacterium]|nr:UDP-N-acetylmuramoyl-L-alanine--D-glutamate ligase [Candidatus Margulisiibacteriota bacterium]